MTTRRLILLAATITVATAVGGLVYSRTRSTQPDATAAKAYDTPPPALVTKTRPARPLNEREHQLVGTWKLVSQHPPPNPMYDARIEYRDDALLITHIHHPLDGARRHTGSWQLKSGTIVRTLRADIVQVEVIQKFSDQTMLTIAQFGRISYEYQWERILP